MKDALTAFLLISGAAFFLISAIGVVRLPDVFSRMHAASKSSSLGMGLILMGVALHFGEGVVTLKCALTLLFIFITAPVAAHILGRAGYVGGARTWEKTTVDELRDLHPGAKS